MALARVSPFSLASRPSPLLQSFFRPLSSDFPLRSPRRRSSPIAAAFSLASQSAHTAREGQVMEAPWLNSRRPWKPTCLYYTQGKCTMMNDAMHLEKFGHNLKMDLPVNASATDKFKPQKLEYFLILDLEGRVEILEFPVVMIDAQSTEFIDSFHRFVRPTAMSEQRTAEYIEGKYGKFGVDRGEVALPGGKAEEGDADDAATALRESKEEIGLDPSLVTIVTSLEHFLSKHLLVVVPIVGILSDINAFKPVLNAAEVDQIFDVPLEMFLKDENRTFTDLEWMGQEFTIHHFSYAKGNEKYMIWGLTAGILIHAASVVYERPPDFAEKRAQFNLPKYSQECRSMP